MEECTLYVRGGRERGKGGGDESEREGRRGGGKERGKGGG